VWVDRDDDLMDVTVVSDGKPSVVHTTQHHPLWDVTRHAWVEADQLTPGDLLRSVDGATVTYTSETVVPGTADMWDLTITSDHDFYIHTGNAGTVLVHNCPSSQSGPAKSVNQMQKQVEKGDAPRGIKRVDKGNPDHGEQDHVHFDDDSALNRDGTWKHGSGSLNRSQESWLRGNGWRIS